MPAPIAPGTVLGSYVVLEPIGRGGMGWVYKARHELLRRVVALKLIRAELVGQGDAEARFRGEMQLVAQLSHPNIVTAYDAQRDGERTFLAMEFCDGQNLRQVVRLRGPLAPGLACELMRQAATGLWHAHQRGLVHGDIKPDNLLLAGSTLKILDFGLARLHRLPAGNDPANSKTPAGGTPDFMAPELATEPQRADPRSDLYSLGATFYFVLTGQPPFPGGTEAEKILRQRLETPPEITDRRPDLPAKLGGVVARLLDKQADARFQTAAELAEELAALKLPIESLADQTQSSSSSEPETATENTTVAAPSLPLADFGSPGSLSQATGRGVFGSAGRVRKALAAATCALVVCAVLSGASYFPLGFPIAQSRASVAGTSGSEAAGMEAASRPAATEWKLDYTFGPLPNRSECVAFSPDSQLLVAALGSFANQNSHGGLRMWDVNTRREHVQLPEQHDVVAVAFSPDARTFVSSSIDHAADPPAGEIVIWDTSTWQPRDKIAGQPFRGSLSFNRDGTRLAIAGRSNAPQVWDVSGAKAHLVGVLPEQENVVSRAVYSPDGTLLASAGRNLPLQLWSAETLELVRTVSSGPLRAAKSTWAAWSADGTRLAAATNNWPEQVHSELFVWDLPQDVLLRYGRQARNFGPCVFTPLGDAVVTGDAEALLVWSLGDSRPPHVLDGPNGDWFPNAAISPDGQWLAAIRASDDTVKLYRLPPR
jgi:serine/threonine protein kinase